MEVVGPVPIQPVPPAVGGVEVARGVVLVGLGEDVGISGRSWERLAVGDLGDLGEDVAGAPVVDLVGRVEPEAVESVIPIHIRTLSRTIERTASHPLSSKLSAGPQSVLYFSVR